MRPLRCTHPVIDDLDANPFARLCRQSDGKLLPNVVRVNDVTLEMDRPCGRADGLKPCRVIRNGVFEELDLISGYEGSPRSPRKGLVRQNLQRGQSVSISSVCKNGGTHHAIS